MRTPEDIKNGMEWSATTDVIKKVEMAKKGLPYAYSEDLASDALAYIRQLESRLAQVERERDAAVWCLIEAAKDGATCTGCRHDPGIDAKCEEADFDCKQ